MSLSAFTDKAKTPKPRELELTLGRSHAAWQTLVDSLADRYEPLSEEWTFPGAKWGWSMRLKHKKRAVLYLTPLEKQFRAGLVLGEKAVAAAQGMALPDEVLELIDTAKRYPEGRAVHFDLRFKKDLAVVLQLAEAKMST